MVLMMNEEEIKSKLEEYVKDGGDDAALPAVLLSLLESQKQNTKNFTEIKKKVGSLLESQKRNTKNFTDIKKHTTFHVWIAAVAVCAAILSIPYLLSLQ